MKPVGGGKKTILLDTARSPIEWYRPKHIHVQKWPCHTADLNPIWNLWQDFKIDVQRHSQSNRMTEV